MNIKNFSVLLIILGAISCGDDSSDTGTPDAASRDASDVDVDAAPPDPGLPYARGLTDFRPGPGAGFGQDALPDVVLGPPDGQGPELGSTDVVSLGVGGEIVVGFAPLTIIDGPGPDLIVFENPFWIGGDPMLPFVELGEVSVSADGDNWTTFSCDVAGDGQGGFPGCAGWTPTNVYDAAQVVPLDPAVTGGDVFDLADVGVTEVRFVRIRDLADDGAAPTAGFDVDAVGAIHVAQE